MLKVCVFRYLFWFVLVIVFVAGANRISIFGLGYLMACFYLLLCGTAMLRRPLRARLMLWDCLILYNVTVIVAKNMLAVGAGHRCAIGVAWGAEFLRFSAQLLALHCDPQKQVKLRMQNRLGSRTCVCSWGCLTYPDFLSSVSEFQIGMHTALSVFLHVYAPLYAILSS